MSTRLASMLVLVSTFFVLGGCSSGPAFAPVSGKVTKDGKPLAGVSVGFQPNAKMNPGSGSYAKTESDGSYELKLVTTDQPGAVVGPHKVFITLPGKGPAKGGSIDDAAGKYFKPKQFEFEVPAGGTRSADFEYEKGK